MTRSRSRSRTATLTVDTVEQFALEVAAKDKTEALINVLDAERPDQALIFVRTKIRCDQLFRTLRDRGMNVRALHGDMSQGARDGVMISFKSGAVPLLVATDVASRGLDISGISHVINYDVPISPDVYVHRIGRTGRVGRSGRAITFYEPRQARDIVAIENHAGVKLSPWVKDARVAPTPARRRRGGTQSRTSRPTAPGRIAKLIVSGGLGRGPRAVGHHPRDHLGRSARRRGGPQRADAAAVRVRRGARRRRRARRGAGRRDRRPRPRAPLRAGADLSPPARRTLIAGCDGCAFVEPAGCQRLCQLVRVWPQLTRKGRVDVCQGP